MWTTYCFSCQSCSFIKHNVADGKQDIVHTTVSCQNSLFATVYCSVYGWASAAAEFSSCTLIIIIFFQFGNVGSVVKSALMRCCDVVSWYVAIPGVIYPCASLSLFSWFEFKIKQAVTCAECVCQSRSPPRLFSARTASNVGPRQSIVKESDGFFAPCYVIEMYILGFKPRWWSFQSCGANLSAIIMSTCDWQ